MSFVADDVIDTLESLERKAARPDRYVIAFSGGVDSLVLLHALASRRARHGRKVACLHVDHQLDPASPDWAYFCREVARGLEVDVDILRVDVERQGGQGLEAAARSARYDALSRRVHKGDWLLSAHHQDDQAETLLLALLRGSGPLGVAAMPGIRRFGDAWLARPLLGVTRAELETYARREGLDWIEDPSNADDGPDRNFLRLEILPRLEARFQGTSSRLARSSELAGEAQALLDELAAVDLAAAGGEPGRLSLDAVAGLSTARRRNLIRFAIRRLGLALPPAARLDELATTLIEAGEDTQPLVEWPGGRARRYRNELYLDGGRGAPMDIDGMPLMPGRPLALGAGLGRLELEEGAGTGLSEAVLARGLTVQTRRGGERFQPLNHKHTKKLKKLLQEEGVVPWMRDRIPLVYAGDELVAVGDLWLADSACSRPGVAVRWRDRPALH